MCEHDMCSIFSMFLFVMLPDCGRFPVPIGYFTAMNIEIIVGHHTDAYIETNCLYERALLLAV